MSQPPSGSLSENQVPAQLAACPSTPNCVQSGARGQAAIAAFSVQDVIPDAIPEATDGQVMRRLSAILESDGAVIKKITDRYIWATYRSRLLRFVDDIEFLLSSDGKEIDVRSASRVGHSDLGVNRKRVERLRAAWLAAPAA